jgi:putative ABC transport system permease protein
MILTRARLSAALPAGTLLVTSETRNSQVSEMTAAFRFNLTALSLLALLVGVFLIYNAMTFSVVQRRSLFGTLRSIGYTREQVFGMVLGEAALVGALGVGLGLGWEFCLARARCGWSPRPSTIFSLSSTCGAFKSLPSSLLKGGLAGFLASLCAAGPPAWEAASVPPRLALSRAGLESRARSAVGLAAGLGFIAVLLGIFILAIPTRDLPISFSGTFAVIMGLALLTPLVTVTLMRRLTEPLGRLFGLLGRLAPRNVIRSQSRTGVAVAALMIAVSVTIGVQVMIGSFRATVTLWLEQTLRGDLYIAAQSLGGTRANAPLDPQVIARAQAHPMVEASLLMRVSTLESEYGPLEMVAVSPELPMDSRLFLSAQGSPEQAWQMVRDGAILLSEPLANRLGRSAAPGQSLDLLTPLAGGRFRSRASTPITLPPMERSA